MKAHHTVCRGAIPGGRYIDVCLKCRALMLIQVPTAVDVQRDAILKLWSKVPCTKADAI